MQRYIIHYLMKTGFFSVAMSHNSFLSKGSILLELLLSDVLRPDRLRVGLGIGEPRQTGALFAVGDQCGV